MIKPRNKNNVKTIENNKKSLDFAPGNDYNEDSDDPLPPRKFKKNDILPTMGDATKDRIDQTRLDLSAFDDDNRSEGSVINMQVVPIIDQTKLSQAKEELELDQFSDMDYNGLA